MIAPISLGRARRKRAWRASPARQRELEGPIRILCDASQPTYDQCALGGHHGVARARLVRRRRDGEVQIIRTEPCLRPTGYCSVSAPMAQIVRRLQKPRPVRRRPPICRGGDRRPPPRSSARSGGARRERLLPDSPGLCQHGVRMALPANQFRYALYLAPPPDSDLWRFGCDVIGRDAKTGATCEGFSLESYPPDSWRSMTSDPRCYGFHATIKAPFPLRFDVDLADLLDRVGELAREVLAVRCGRTRRGCRRG